MHWNGVHNRKKKKKTKTIDPKPHFTTYFQLQQPSAACQRCCKVTTLMILICTLLIFSAPILEKGLYVVTWPKIKHPKKKKDEMLAHIHVIKLFLELSKIKLM